MQKKIHFVTGKGGVGKSVFAAALALKSGAESSTLLVELGDQSFYQDYLQTPPISYHPVALEKFSVALWSGAECLKEYARHLIKIEALYRLFFENAVMRTFINIAPALPELAVMGKVTSGPRKHGPPLHFETLVIDAYATGHFLALMNASPAMAQAVPFGPMGEQSRSISQTLKTKDLCEFHIVTLPEEMPLKETLELKKKLESDFNITPKIYLNKVFDLPDAEKAPKDAFGDYLRYQHEKTCFARDYLKNAGVEFYELPWVLEASGWKIVKGVAEALP